MWMKTSLEGLVGKCRGHQGHPCNFNPTLPAPSSVQVCVCSNGIHQRGLEVFFNWSILIWEPFESRQMGWRKGALAGHQMGWRGMKVLG